MSILNKVVNNVRIQNRCHTLNEWDELPAEESRVMEKEIAIVMSNDNSRLLGIVVGEGQVYELYNRKEKVLFPGIGAGYTLPNASSITLGGIKINELYFKMSDTGVLNPVSLTYKNISGENRVLSLPENHSLNVPGDITTTSIHYQNLYELFVQSNYIGVRKGISTTRIEEVTCSIAGQINLPGLISGTITFIPEITNYSVRQNTTNTTIFSSSFIVGETYVARYDLVSNEQLPILPSNEYEGLQFFNYKEGEDSLPDSERTVAEIAIDNSGMLVYSADNKSLSNYKKIALAEDQNYFIINVDGVQTKYYPFSTRMNNNTNKSINLSQNFCTSVIVNGVKFDLKNDRSINIGNIVRNVSGNNGLTSAQGEDGAITISHSEAANLDITTNKVSISDTSKLATAITAVARDSYGHLTGITTTIYDFAAVLESIKSLKESVNDIPSLQTKVDNITTEINSLKTKISNIESSITSIEERLSALENHGQA